MNSHSELQIRIDAAAGHYDWRGCINVAMQALSESRRRGQAQIDAKTIGQVCMHYPEAVDYVAMRFDSGNVSLKAGIIAGFCDIGRPIPGVLQSKFVDYAENGTMSAGDAAFDTAVIVLAHCTELSARASRVLARCLCSRCWYHRGNAAVSLALLGDLDESAIHKIGDLVFDPEGNMDWSASGSALRAIAILGKRAQCLAPLLQKFANQPGPHLHDNGPLLAKAFERIEDAGPATIEALIGMITRGGCVAPWYAIEALNRVAEIVTLGSHTDTAMKTIAGFALSEDATELLYEWADVLQIAMITIGGAEHPQSRRVHAYLKTIDWLDHARHTKPFTAIFGQNRN